MPLPKSAGLRLQFNHRPLLFYLLARGLAEFAHQIGVVVVGWQIYTLTGSAFDLGLAGLAQFVPTMLLFFAAGHFADRYDRKRVLQICQIMDGLTAAFLAWGSFAGWLTVPEIFGAVAVFGVGTAFESPATASLLPAVAPEGMVQKGTALTTGVMQVATIGAPALGGLAYVIAPGAPYAAMAAFWLIAAMLNGAIRTEQRVIAKEPATFSSLFAGVRFVFLNRSILGTISLDLFVVLLGGATALLPIYAHDILHTGPWGLGVLRGAPALGALLMTALLTRHEFDRRVGIRMFQAIIVFGFATVVFAVSHLLWLSILALAVLGAADTVSMVVRVSLVQLSTPDDMRGRVSAVNYLFVNASYQLGEFESGITAAMFGAMPAALLGGLGTIAVAYLWMKLFPTLRDLDRLE